MERINNVLDISREIINIYDTCDLCNIQYNRLYRKLSDFEKVTRPFFVKCFFFSNFRENSIKARFPKQYETL